MFRALVAWLAAFQPAVSGTESPHIIFIVSDDLGYNDVLFTGTGSEVVTPHLARLASEGVVLGSYYVSAICTPTRASFMTGRYPTHLGLQHGVILDGVPDAVPANETMMPEVLRRAGYATHMVGKWHLGFHQPQYTPERRGFDSTMGYYTGNTDFWNHTSPCWHCGNFTALDLHRANSTHFEPLVSFNDIYSTTLFASEAVARIEEHAQACCGRPLFLYVAFEAVHGASSCFREGSPPDCAYPTGDELQAPEHFVEQQRRAGIRDERRAKFAAMVGALDEAVGNISAALDRTGLSQRALLVFTTDNGAPNGHFDGRAMSNYPLRGGKGTNFEGGVRGAAFVHSRSTSLLPKERRGKRSMSLLHCTDWLPTLAALAGAELNAKERAALDGFDAWPAIAAAGEAVRGEVLHGMDPVAGESAIRVGRYKYLLSFDAAHGADPRAFSGLPKGRCLFEDICPRSVLPGRLPTSVIASGVQEYLFDIWADPQETDNLAGSSNATITAVLGKMKQRLQHYERSMVPVRRLAPDPAARPASMEGLSICTPSPKGPILCGDVGVWRPWQAESGTPFMQQHVVI